MSRRPKPEGEKRMVAVDCKGGCGYPLRPLGTKAADWPGTKSERAELQCDICYKKALKLNGASNIEEYRAIQLAKTKDSLSSWMAARRSRVGGPDRRAAHVRQTTRRTASY